MHTEKKSGSTLDRDAVPGPVACESCDLHEICRIIECTRTQLPSGRLRVIRKGDALCGIGSPAESVYAPRKGMLKSVRQDGNGQPRVRAIHVPGEVIGDEILSTAHYANDVIAITPVICCEIPAQVFSKNNLARLPALSRAAARLMNRQPTATDVTRAPLSERIGAFFGDVSLRLAQRGFDPRQVTLEITRKEISSRFDRGANTIRRALKALDEKRIARLQDNGVRLRLVRQASAQRCTSLSERRPTSDSLRTSRGASH